MPKLTKPKKPTPSSPDPSPDPSPSPQLPARAPDLVPLPAPANVWPDHQPLDPLTVSASLWHGAGNLHRAAALLGTSTARLGAFLRNNPELQETRSRAAELALDRAEEVILDKLEDPERQEDNAKWLLMNAGRPRGYGRDGGQPLFAFGQPAGQGQIAIKWDIPE